MKWIYIYKRPIHSLCKLWNTCQEGTHHSLSPALPTGNKFNWVHMGRIKKVAASHNTTFLLNDVMKPWKKIFWIVSAEWQRNFEHT